MKIFMSIGISLLMFFAIQITSFAQDEEELMENPGVGRDPKGGHIWFSPDKGTTNKASPVAKPGASQEKAGINRGIRVEGRDGTNSSASPTTVRPGAEERTYRPIARPDAVQPAK